PHTKIILIINALIADYHEISPKSPARRAVDGKKSHKERIVVRAVETRVSGYALFNAPYSPPVLVKLNDIKTVI
ncbi:hypothetical protein AB7441_22725, partial [Providencia rettgeri]